MFEKKFSVLIAITMSLAAVCVLLEPSSWLTAKEGVVLYLVLAFYFLVQGLCGDCAWKKRR